jgi:HAD superfamily hydrolase (TIGR01509 family)
MVVRAAAFDIGGVLERVGPVGDWLAPWQDRLGMSEPEFESALSRVDPDNLNEAGGLTEAEYSQRFATALGLSNAQAAEFMADMWRWYCGELDAELIAYVAGLRPRYLTAILSNSAAGARREEQARYSFAEQFDVIIYPHEAGLAKPDPQVYALPCAELSAAPDELIFVDDVRENVDAASRLDINAVLHVSTPESVAVIGSLVAA